MHEVEMMRERAMLVTFLHPAAPPVTPPSAYWHSGTSPLDHG